MRRLLGQRRHEAGRQPTAFSDTSPPPPCPDTRSLESGLTANTRTRRMNRGSVRLTPHTNRHPAPSNGASTSIPVLTHLAMSDCPPALNRVPLRSLRSRILQAANKLCGRHAALLVWNDATPFSRADSVPSTAHTLHPVTGTTHHDWRPSVTPSLTRKTTTTMTCRGARNAKPA